MKAFVSHSRFGGLASAAPVVIVIFFVAIVLAQGMVAGKQRTVLLLLMLSLALVLYLPLLVRDIRGRWLLALPLLFFWVPVPAAISALPPPLAGFSLVEALVLLSLVTMAARLMSNHHPAQTSALRTFPWIGFLLVFAGVALAYEGTPQTSDGTSILRAIVLLPFALGLLIVLVVRNSDDARRALWVLLASSSVLGLLFLAASSGAGGLLGPSAYGASMGLGRASLALTIPGFGIVELNPESAGDKFAIAFSLAWFLLLTSSRAASRAAAAIAAVICGAVVVTAQGRGGLVACVLSVALLGAWAMRRGPRLRVAAAVATLGAIAAFLGSAVLLALRSHNSEYAARMLGLLTDPQNEVYSGRAELWREGYAYAVSHPLGLGLYPPEYGTDSAWLTHNLWLFAALVFGWLGLAGLVWIVVSFGVAYVRALPSRGEAYSGLALLGLVVLLVVLVTGMFSPLVWGAFSAVFVWAPLWITFAVSVRPGRKDIADVGAGRH